MERAMIRYQDSMFYLERLAEHERALLDRIIFSIIARTYHQAIVFWTNRLNRADARDERFVSGEVVANLSAVRSPDRSGRKGSHSRANTHGQTGNSAGECLTLPDEQSGCSSETRSSHWGRKPERSGDCTAVRYG